MMLPKVQSVFTLSMLAVSLGACGGDEQNTTPDSGNLSDAGVSDAVDVDSDWLFEPDRLLEIAIEMDNANWDRLRVQSRNVLGILGETCGLQPAGSPFTYFPASVTIDGETVEEVGVRKKGFLGSVNDVKPSLKFKFSEYRNDQRFSGLKRMTLNNGIQDPSLLNQCLGYQLFAKAGVPSPRCNYAHVTLNGESLGVYAHVENVKKPFLRRHFADDSGNLYEGTLSDFRDGWMGTFERKTNKAMPPESEDRSDLVAIQDALALEDAAMYAALEELIDLDEFIRFWAMETMVGHWDGYSGNNNNYFVYDDPSSGLIAFLPWGVDQLFGQSGGTVIGLPAAATRSTLTHRLFLYEPSRTRYLARFEELLDSAWDDAQLVAEIDRMRGLIASSVPSEELATFDDGVTALRAAITGREEELRAAHAAANPQSIQSVGEPLCFDEDGSVTSSFSADYNGGISTDVTINLVIGKATIPFNSPTVFALPSDDIEGQSVLFVSGRTSPTRAVHLFISLPDSEVQPGPIEVGRGAIEGFVFFEDDGASAPDSFAFLGGTMTLQSGAPSAGSTWQGSLDLSVWTSAIFN